MCENGKQGPCNGNGRGEVSLRGREGVSSGCSLEEQEGEEDKYFGPDASGVLVCIDTEGVEGGEDYKDGCPAMVEGEGEVDEEFIGERLSRMMLLDNVVDVSDGGTNEEGKNERPNVVMGSPQVDVDGIQDCEKREAPRNAIDDDRFSAREELVNDSEKEKKVDKRPDEESPGSGCDIGFLAVEVDVFWRHHGVDV